jgi:hypothetical protein
MKLKVIKDFIDLDQIEPFPYEGTSYYFDTERVPVNFARLLPGYFYTFVSIANAVEDELLSLDEYQIGPKSKKPYFDRRPIFLSLGQEGPMEVGLNVKLMPFKLRRWFLQRYLKHIYPTMVKLVDESGDLATLNSRIRMQETASLYGINRQFVRAISEQTGLKLEFLVDKYTRGEMGNPLALIDWDQIIKMGRCNYIHDKSILSKTPISYFLTKFT